MDYYMLQSTSTALLAKSKPSCWTRPGRCSEIFPGTQQEAHAPGSKVILRLWWKLCVSTLSKVLSSSHNPVDIVWYFKNYLYLQTKFCFLFVLSKLLNLAQTPNYGFKWTYIYKAVSYTCIYTHEYMYVIVCLNLCTSNSLWRTLMMMTMMLRWW